MEAKQVLNHAINGNDTFIITNPCVECFSDSIAITEILRPLNCHSE